ncbi:MAG: 1-(5-phosphoribosyl)-5-[(5-phosphoribosylamino)methylideneamino] imidazole-4-carboxamide isomerase [Sphaerochaetaceae bacterium]|jgi:phosphoribosylformimino-5-aminoimidazole carboxamide ribotide isomerase|nr:1-(5-phosphoribosyl)-5-[(5-phosphoribosylamino)methylideneamino] imidazole-4-carboxamide isomerase [Sphaerochaetaceae bacterium]MDY0371283.1 1-(5-phosphoribosyl)-5-[(5-phosphoribosylamino)methylideneamino] imidazole-4-carboxamide isomerase [Sphaerochaetaceae bacterium]
MVIIPAMDIIDGRCVRLRMGDYSQKTIYGEDPLTMAKKFSDAGLQRLHMVDLDGAKAKHTVNLKVLEQVAHNTPLIIDVGGGLQSKQDFANVFSAGASMATVGSLAAEKQDLTLELLSYWGPDKLILGADCRHGMIAVSGWQQTTTLSLFDFVAFYLEKGFKKVISTDISRDGMLNGPATALYGELMQVMQAKGFALELIASGGVRSLADLDELDQAGLAGAIIGKALYEGVIEIPALAAWQIRGE